MSIYEIRSNARPSLTDTVENMAEYDVVFVGYPVWWHATPAPINTFLESYDLTGKLIIPFCTSGGSDIDETMPTFLNSCDGLAVYGERRISGTNQLDGWLSELGLTSQERQDRPEQEETGLQETMPEEVQGETTKILDLENPPAYTYRQQETLLDNQGQRIYGIVYIPDTEKTKVPLVICAHGLGGSYCTNMAYAEQLASHGIAAYCFDFRGGGGTMSDGDTTEMSVMTEVSDLEVILEAAAGWDFVDTEKIVLLGTSQGGIASAIAAARHADEVSGLVLMYPAFLVSDAIHEQFDSLEDVPDTFRFNWITAGRPYAEDMWDYDVYAEIGNYTEKVLLMHGDRDGIVPISYSERAAEVYADVDYFVINGAGHGFSGSAFEEAVGHIFDYLQEVIEADANGGNVLIAYFSHTGNTEEAAQKIEEYTGGTLAEIQRAEEYEDLQEEAEVEILNGVHPEITVSVDNISEYDTIFVGYPIWWDEAPAMIATFLAENDFSGKTIIPFCTSSSDDIGNSLHIFSELCPNAEIAEGLTANNLNDIEPWIQRLGLME